MYFMGKITQINHFTSKVTCSTHIDASNYLFYQKACTMSVHKSLLWRIVSACAIPLILYYSPIISLDCLIKTSSVLKNAYVCYQLPVV